MMNCQPNVFLLAIDVFKLRFLEWCSVSFGGAHFINKNSRASLGFQKKKKPWELVNALIINWWYWGVVFLKAVSIS